MMWEQLRRRKVLRTCALYLVACWVLLQAVDLVFPALGQDAGQIPRYLLYGTLGGLPLVAMLAWYFQITPRGIRRSDDFVERRLLNNLVPINERRDGHWVKLGKSEPAGHDWELLVESGPLAGLRYAITKPLLLGRGKDCDLTLVSVHVSRHHARLTPREGVLLLEDLDSANGTRVNGERISGEVTLYPGDMIEIKDISLRVTESYARSLSDKSAINQDTIVTGQRSGNSPASDFGHSSDKDPPTT